MKSTMRVLAFTLAALLLASVPAARAADGCSVTFEGGWHTTPAAGWARAPC